MTIAFLAYASTGCADVETTADEDIVKLKAKYALEAWQTENWADMYSVLSSNDKSAMSEADFVFKRGKLAKSRRLVSYSIDNISQSDNNEYIVKITLKIDKDYNARTDNSLENEVETVVTEWMFIDDSGALALTFLES